MKICFALLVYAAFAFTTAKHNTASAVEQSITVYDSLVSEEHYRDGKLKSRCVFNAVDTILQINPETGEETMVITVSNGTTCSYYYPNGKVSYTTQFDQGKKIGPWMAFDTLGNLLKTETYENDILIKTDDRTNYSPNR